MRLIAVIIVVGSLILLGRCFSSHNEMIHRTVSGVTGDDFSQLETPPIVPKQEAILVAAPTTNRNQQLLMPAPAAELPANAKRIRQLSRAVYELPREAAELMNKLFSLESDCDIETKIVASNVSDLVTLEVTADEETQQTVGKFLLTVYPLEKIAGWGHSTDSGFAVAKMVSFEPVSRRTQSRKCVDFVSASASRP